MLTSIKQTIQNHSLARFQNERIPVEQTKALKGGNIIVEEIVLG